MRRIAALNISLHRIAPAYWWAAALGALAVALLAFAASPTSRDANAQVGPCPFTIDFAGLPHGTILAEQYAAQGVHISAVGNAGGPNALIVFDTNLPPTHDPDLAIDIGNIALMALNVTDTSPADGLVDDPDENNFGGTATFAFDHDVSIGSIKWIDKDAVVDNFVIAYNANGDVITSVLVPLGANSSVQTIPINADGVRRLVFDYDESGGFTGIEVDCENPTPTPTAQAETPTPSPQPPTPSPTRRHLDRHPRRHADARAHGPTGPHAQPDRRRRDRDRRPRAVAAAAAAPNAGTSTGAGPSAGALPAGGGAPSPAEGFRWTAALMALALVLGGTWYSRRKEGR